MRADSSYSSGMVMKNWRSRKTFQAEPNQYGTMSGRKVSSQFRFFHRMNWGTIRTVNGIIRVEITPRNMACLPGKSMRAKA